MPARYVCGECGNTVEAVHVEKRVRGSKAHAVVMPKMVLCERHGGETEMKREEYKRARPEVGGWRE